MGRLYWTMVCWWYLGQGCQNMVVPGGCSSTISKGPLPEANTMAKIEVAICLSMGFIVDNLDVIIGAATVLDIDEVKTNCNGLIIHPLINNEADSRMRLHEKNAHVYIESHKNDPVPTPYSITIQILRPRRGGTHHQQHPQILTSHVRHVSQIDR
jgi:hypothetical protein